MTTLLLFFYLQLLDLLTTYLAILHGFHEANPIVQVVMHLSPNPMLGLVGWKVFSTIAYAWFCCTPGRMRYLTICNWWYTVVPVWNLAVLIAGGVR